MVASSLPLLENSLDVAYNLLYNFKLLWEHRMELESPFLPRSDPITLVTSLDKLASSL